MVDLDVSSVPLVELGVAAALELTGYLSLVETSLRTLDGLGEGSRPSRVRIGGNADLVSLAGLRVLADLGALVLLRTDICHEVWRGCGLTYVEPESTGGNDPSALVRRLRGAAGAQLRHDQRRAPRPRRRHV